MSKLLRILFLGFLCVAPYLPVSAQIGGDHTYKFLTLSNSARISGLGGNALAVMDNDVTITLANPSLITPEMHNKLALSYVNYMTGNNVGFVMYSRSFSKAGSFVASLQFNDYGTTQGADAAGNKTGEITASEYALTVGWGRTLTDHFSIGANAKLIYSHLDVFNSFGIAVDVAGSYFTKDKLFTASIMARNIGSQIVPYRAGQYESLPFELQLGLSQGLKHLPLRFYLLFTNLQRWDLRYTDSNDPKNQVDPYTGTVDEKSGISKFADNLMRHIVIGGEITIAKVFSIRLGYNYQRRQELKLFERTGLSGFTYGAGFRVKMFDFSFTHATYQAGSPNPNYITIAVNLQEFSKKK
ncbi:MAG: type IX secretion system protein PorQ [Bacteroidales bacterium]|nr:type IX secretion system protein PorQ [Bacteroidales bacterium]